MEENFFENEFLEYLNKNTNGNYKIFDESKSEYTFFENELIRSISDMVKDLVNKMSEGRGILPDIHVFCVENELVNAFCFVTNNRYYIGIHSATYIELIRRTQILADYLVLNSYWGYYKNKEVVEVQALLWTYAFKMILAHEYMHVILGHCDTICADMAFMWENDSIEKEKMSDNIPIIDLQAMEMFADEFSAIDAAWQILSIDREDIEKSSMIY